LVLFPPNRLVAAAAAASLMATDAAGCAHQHRHLPPLPTHSPPHTHTPIAIMEAEVAAKQVQLAALQRAHVALKAIAWSGSLTIWWQLQVGETSGWKSL
jgi:hypothetical protein